MCWKCEDARYHGPCDTEAEGRAYGMGKRSNCEKTCANVSRCEDACVGYQEKEVEQ